jgi:hypothetical protein
MGVVPKWRNLECHARRSGCRDFKSANSYYLDGKTHPNYAFSRIAFSWVITRSRFSIDALLEEVTIAPQRMLQENTTAPCFAKTIKYMMKRAIVLFVVWIWYKHLTPAKTMYTCPMHPEIIQGGLCPTCGMDLVPMEPTKVKTTNVS